MTTSRMSDRLIFIGALVGMLWVLVAWRTTGELTVAEQIKQNEGE